MNKKSFVLWWKISEGKYVAHESGAKLDSPTQALVRDLMTSEAISRAFQGKTGNAVSIFRLAMSPLPFEPIQDWMTWTLPGSEINQ